MRPTTTANFSTRQARLYHLALNLRWSAEKLGNLRLHVALMPDEECAYWIGKIDYPAGSEERCNGTAKKKKQCLGFDKRLIL